MPISPSSRSAPAPAAAPPSRLLPSLVLLLALAGLAVAADLWLLWHHAHGGGGSAFCDISDRLSCSRVALSPFSAVLGVPVAAWGALAYLLVACLAGWALARGPHPGFPGGVLVVLTGAMVACAAVLAYVSEVVIGAFCVMCAASWTLSIALFVCAILLARRAGGTGAAVRADLDALRAQRGLAGGGAVGFAAVAIGLLALYAAAPWKKPAAPVTTASGARSLPPGGAPGSVLVYEYSDYMCPHCAVFHGQEKDLVARRPDLRFIRRFFPLDAKCNPMMQSTIPGHEVSCELARGGVCAEKQGRFEPYDDAAFASQGKGLGAEAIATQVGLDLAAFRDCLASPETEQRIGNDVQSGINAGVHGTPSLQIQGKLYSSQDLFTLLGLPVPK